MSHQFAKQGIYQRAGKVNGKTSWISSINNNAIWYNAGSADWMIGPLDNLGTYFGGLQSEVQETGRSSCPYTVDTWEYWNNWNSWIIADNDISVECLAGCTYGELVGNGQCNDEANNANCIYDGGECCGACINTESCSECFCHQETAPAIDLTCCLQPHLWLIELDYCFDATNTANCNFDGGHCCEANANTDFCQDCICYEDLNCNASLDLIGNGYCNDETNNAECNFDAGDCCGSCASMEQCSDCQCLDGSPTNYLCKKRMERALLKTL